MVLVIGEVHQDQVVIGFLERFADFWEGHGIKFHVPAFDPTFITLSFSELYESEDRMIFSFRSHSGHSHTGSFALNPSNACIVSCNNRHIIRPCTIWPKIQKSRPEILFHLGDQIYADRIYWRWWRYLCYIDESKWELYSQDIRMEYFREYIETWEPLQSILANSINILIPDDHEIRCRAKLWPNNELLNSDHGMHGLPRRLEYYLGGAHGEKFSFGILDLILKPEEDNYNKALVHLKLEEFLCHVALETVRKLYLGLRITNKQRFDYFKVINECAIIMHERITQGFLNEEFIEEIKDFLKFSECDRVLFMSGLPPVPIRPNFFELLFYRYVNRIPDDKYSKLYDILMGKDVILVGGDLHVGACGEIYQNQTKTKTKTKLGKFHISSPSSGFCSIYIPSDSISVPLDYSLKLEKYQPSDPNAVFINLNKFESKHVFAPAGLAEAWQNTLFTGFCFWSD